MAPSTNLRRGISLIEILIAVAFLAFGLAGVTDMYITQMKQAARVRQQQSASAIAASALAELQSAGFAALDAKMLTLPKSGGAENEADLFAKPAASLSKDVEWNAHLKKEQQDGMNRIRITVTAGYTPVSAKNQSVRKEAVGYVAAP